MQIPIYSASASFVGGRLASQHKKGFMIQSMVDSVTPKPPKRSHPILLLVGYLWL
jgi:hypothetical protein